MISARWKKYDLWFRFRAGTSRGFLDHKTSYFIILSDENNLSGIGECGPLTGLSPDARPEIETRISRLCREMNGIPVPEAENLGPFIDTYLSPEWPSLKMGLETALLDLLNGGKRVIFKNDFISGRVIPINGLIWMGDREFLTGQVDRKIDEGYRCIKMKIGALDFDTEIAVLDYIRTGFPGLEISIRVDANGAFSPEEALKKMELLSNLGIHSIEQPIPAGNPEIMAELCRKAAIPVALDEELIGGYDMQGKKTLLEVIRPAYIVIKPTLIGGFKEAGEWIRTAESMGIGWWITSALESDIGLNAIAQYTLEHEPEREQGLGTGQLFRNNFPSPLRVSNGGLSMNGQGGWDLSGLGIGEIQDHT